MKPASSLLWQLIKSLTNSEKLFFKRNYVSSGQKDKTYLLLFNAIEVQKKYDEAKIIKKLSPAITKKNIAFQKHYLQQQICDAIIHYDNKNDPYYEIYNQIQLIRLYRKKGLLNEAHNIWKKATRQARKAELFALLNILKSEFEKMVLFSSAQVKYDEMLSIFKSNIIGYDEYANLITLRDIYTETILLKKKAHYYVNEPLKEQVLKLLNETDKYTDASESHSFWYYHYYYMNKATLFSMLNDFDNSTKLLKLVLTKWHTNPQFINTGGEFFLELLYMINYAGVLHGDYAFVTETFNHPFNNILSDPIQKANFETTRFLAFNKIYNKTARYKEVKALISETQGAFPKWSPFLNADLNFTANLSIAISAFVLESFDDSMYYVRQAFSFLKASNREDLFDIGQLLLLLITYNMNNIRQFEAQYRSTYNYYYKRKRKFPFEAALVQCLHRTFYLTGYSDKIKEYKMALEVFEQNKDDIVQKMTFKVFNYPGWLTSRIQRVSYRQYVENTVKAGRSFPIVNIS